MSRAEARSEIGEPRGTVSSQTLRRRRWRAILGPMAIFAISFAALLALYSRSPLLYDTDAYYHLSIARAQAEEGLKHEQPWVRFGLLGKSWSDKESFFHLALSPWVAAFESPASGWLALAFFDALLLAVIGWAAARAVGSWGLLIPIWLVFSSAELAWRLVRLRPELLAMSLLLAALMAAARRRHLLLGLLGALFALSYTAVHAFVGLFALIFVADLWATRKPDWGLALFPTLGASLGLLFHPQFPNNLVGWWFQNVEFFRFKGLLDVGTEIRPNFTDVTLMANLGWWLGLAILWRSGRRHRDHSDPHPSVRPDESLDERSARAFGVAAIVFGILYLLMSRFVLYAVPFVTLWLLFEMRRRHLEPGGSVRLPWRGRLPFAAAVALCLLVSAPLARAELERYLQRTASGPGSGRLADREALADLLPAAAQVAAPWQATPLYMFWAPQGRYLNVLDPVFLAAIDPEIHEAQSAVFSGREPDVPAAVVGLLESEFLALPQTGADRDLVARLGADPRVDVLLRGADLVARFSAPPAGSFLLDWRLVPAAVELPVGPEVDSASWFPYPRASDSAVRAIEGYVDARRIGGERECVGLVHELSLESPEERTYELSASGPSVLWADGGLVARIAESGGATLGRGTVLPLHLETGDHRLSLLTCPGTDGLSGFFFLRRTTDPK